MKIVKGFNKSEIATRYFKKLGKFPMSRQDACIRLTAAKHINEDVLTEVFNELVSEQDAIFNELKQSGKVKFYSTKIK